MAITFFFSAAYPLLAEGDFKLAPPDKISFYGRKEKVTQVCVPPEPGENGVEWWKGNETLVNNDRISMFTSDNVQKYVKHTNPGFKKLYVLEFDPILPEDVGEYFCVDKNTSKVSKFRIMLVDKCGDKFFKCSTGKDACVDNSTVCDGKKDCIDASDESVNVGCSYPSAPENFHSVARSWHQVKLKWSPVEKVLSYDVINNDKEVITVPPSKTSLIFEQLRPGETYNFSIRAKSYTGNSNFSLPIEVKTRLFYTLKIPMNIETQYIEGLGIVVCWWPLPDAVSYQVAVNFPLGSTEIFDVTEPSFALRSVTENGTYGFRVRQVTEFDYGKYSKKTTMKVQVRNAVEEDSSLQFSVNVNGNLTLHFRNSFKYTSQISCISYSMEICQRMAVYREWTTNETLVSDVVIQNYYNATKNTSETVSFKNYTIHYDMKHIEFDRYDNISCVQFFSDDMRFKVDGLVAKSNYSYRVDFILIDQMVGTLQEGVFTQPSLKPPVGPPTIFTGVVIYGLATGILIVLLLLSFIIAYIVKWDKLMSDLAIKKARVAGAKKDAEMETLTPKLLSDTFISDNTQPHGKYT